MFSAADHGFMARALRLDKETIAWRPAAAGIFAAGRITARPVPGNARTALTLRMSR